MFAYSKCAVAPLDGIVRAMKYRVLEHRKQRGWSQETLAELAGTTKGFISQIENGRRQPSAETLRALAGAFGIDATELIEPDSDDARRIIEHLSNFMRLSAEDQASVARIVVGLLPDPSE